MVLDDHRQQKSSAVGSRAEPRASGFFSRAEPRATARGELPYSALVRGRERVRGVLEPHLGPQHALERANNIVQALAFDDLEPQRVAFEMLRQLPEAQRSMVANLVKHAWLAG
jgi:hypothetical protein